MAGLERPQSCCWAARNFERCQHLGRRDVSRATLPLWVGV